MITVKRGLSLAGLAGAIAIAALLLTTHGGHAQDRSVLYEGTRFGALQTVHHVSDAEARGSAPKALAEWTRELRFGGQQAPGETFANPSPESLRRELAAAARTADFRVVSLDFLRPRQLAPKIVVETRNYRGLARAAPGILARIDPHPTYLSSGRKAGWGYEGFYFEAQDERHVPFLIIFNSLRGGRRSGGQWARSEPLFPYPHG